MGFLKVGLQSDNGFSFAQAQVGLKPDLQRSSPGQMGCLWVGLQSDRPIDHANASSASVKRVTATTSMPSTPPFGALPRGTMARLKPCLAAS